MTPFGARVRQLRAQRGVSLKVMAAALGVSSAYLSALELGQRGKPPWYLVQRVITYFNVIWDDAEELQRLAEVSAPRVTVDTAGLTPTHTRLANRLASDIANLNEAAAAELLGRLEAKLRERR
jgi:transcriptional regulator with XRE-family HTH domain